MKVSERTITRIGQVVTGDKGLSPYRSGPQLVRLFNRFGANDVYGQGFPSRWVYTEDKIREINDSPILVALMQEILDPREFVDTKFDRGAARDYLNEFLKYDGYEVALLESETRIRDIQASTVEFGDAFAGSKQQSEIFIDEQLAKCEHKIRDGDFDGAVTNARSMLEAILLEIEAAAGAEMDRYDGDLGKLYKRVQRRLNLDPARTDISTTIKQVLSGLSGIVSGIAGMSNQMGDRHARTYRPRKRHAVLVVNAAKTLANFLWETKNERS